MSKRLQVLIAPALDARIAKAAQRHGVSKGEWVRQAIERELAGQRTGDALDRLSALGAPTGDLEQILAEIESGRS